MQTTLLDALWTMGEAETVEALESGDLQLTGNFKGREADMVAQATQGDG